MKTIVINSNEIVKETAKAFLIEKEGKSFWVQKRWVREDGTLTAAGIKAFETAKTTEQAEMDKYVQVPKAAIVEEREKCIKVQAIINGQLAPKSGFVSSMVRDFQKETQIFLPKFAIKSENDTHFFFDKNFFLTKKNELKEFYAPANGRFLTMEIMFKIN